MEKLIYWAGIFFGKRFRKSYCKHTNRWYWGDYLLFHEGLISGEELSLKIKNDLKGMSKNEKELV